MDRVSIKNNAKKMIIGNKWYLWKPFVIFMLISALIGFVVGVVLSLFNLSQETVETVSGAIGGIIETVFCVGYAKYCIEFVRGNKLEWKDVFDFIKKHFALAFLVTLVVDIIVTIGSILLVIPGIIAALGLAFYREVCADNPELKVMEVIKKTWALTNGHKSDIFVLILSFIGWAILAPLTLGILYIWLVPYVMITMTLVYEELRKTA